MEGLAARVLESDGRGLTTAQVAERVASGCVNAVPVRTSRSLAAIFRANVLTWFNALIGTLFVIMLVVGSVQDAPWRPAPRWRSNCSGDSSMDAPRSGRQGTRAT